MKAVLLPHHRTHLEAAAISPDVIDGRGYRTVDRDGNTRTDSHDLLRRLGIPGWARKEPARYPGLLIPLYRATGERVSYQYRPDHPPKDPKTGKPRKYASPVGRHNVLDVHPHNRNRIVDPTVPLWITEGVKKGDALTSAGACVVTLTGVFNWRTQLGTLGDWEDVAIKGRTVVLCFDADAATNANVARAMGRLGRWLQSKQVARVVYVVTPAEVNGIKTKGADDYLAAGGTIEQLRAAGTDKPPEPHAADGSLSDAVLAEQVADEVLASRFCWTGGLGWMSWDGRRWRRCEEASVLEAVRQYFLNLFTREIKDGCDGPRRAALYTLLGKGRITSITALTRGIVLQDAAEFDQQPDLLNVANGVVDLRTGDLLPHSPDLLMTKMAGAHYDPDARHPDWDRALEALPGAVCPWFQLRAGQALTGYMTPDDVLVVCQGGGENGKTTVMGALAKATGDYHVFVSDRVLLADAGAHPTELMELRGARLALIEETPEARRLSVARLKKTVGTPKIEARYIRQDSVTFDATHSMFLSTNYRPIVEETDHGTWRRLLLLRFPYRFVKPGTALTGPLDREGDPTLRDRLMRDEKAQAAVLRWLVDGARRWYEADQIMPPPPDSVVTDTRAWRSESDLILCYVDERLVPDPGRHVMSTELLADFNEWLAGRGHRPWSDKTFVSRFGEHDELAAHKIEKKRQRRSDALSRPPRTAFEFYSQPSASVPSMYVAWLGVRFATDADAETRANALTSENVGSVQGVQGASDKSRVEPLGGLTETPCTPCTPTSAASPLFDESGQNCGRCGFPFTSVGHATNCTSTSQTGAAA